MAQLLETDLEDRFAGLHEALVAGDIIGRELGDLGTHRRRITGVVEHFAVGETDAIERADRTQFDIVGQSPPAQFPQLLEQERRGDDGRAGVESEAVLPIDVGAASGRIELLQHRDAISACAKPHRCRQPAETAADDDGVRTGLDRYRRPELIGSIHDPTVAESTLVDNQFVRFIGHRASDRHGRDPIPVSIGLE